MSTPGVQSSANSGSNNQQVVSINQPITSFRFHTSVGYSHLESRANRLNSTLMAIEPYDAYLNNVNIGLGVSYIVRAGGLFASARGSLFFDGGNNFQRIMSAGRILEENNFNYRFGLSAEGLMGGGPQNFAFYGLLGGALSLGNVTTPDFRIGLGIYVAERFFLDATLLMHIFRGGFGENQWTDPVGSLLIRLGATIDLIPPRR